MPNEPQTAPPVEQPPVAVAQETPAPVVTPPLKNREAFYQSEGLSEKPQAAQEPPKEPPKTATEAAPTPDSPDKPAPAKQETPAPKIYAKKFQSPEELEKAYIELQSLQSRKNAEINTAIKDVKAAAKEDKTLAEALVSKSDSEAPDPLLDPQGYKEYLRQDVMRAYAAQQQTEAIQRNWREANADILDLEPLVSYKLVTDPRIREANNLEAVAALINEHTSYARGLATKYREEGKKETQAKFDSIPPSAPQNSLEEPATKQTTQPTDDVSDFIGLRNRARTGLRPVLRSRG